MLCFLHSSLNASAVSFGILTVIALYTLSLYRFFTSVLVVVFLLAIALAIASASSRWYNVHNIEGSRLKRLTSYNNYNGLTAQRFGKSQGGYFFIYVCDEFSISYAFILIAPSAPLQCPLRIHCRCFLFSAARNGKEPLPDLYRCRLQGVPAPLNRFRKCAKSQL